MRLVDLLNQLEQKGLLDQLYNAGALNIKCFNHREIFNHYTALLATPNYAEQIARAVQATAVQLGVARSTVYAARREMTRPLQAQCA